jgi:PAS domain S-box-containing protein
MHKKSREQYLRQLIEVSPIACILTDPGFADNPIVAVNDAFVNLTGYAPEEIMGRNCRFLRGSAAEPAARAVLREAIAKGASAVVELTNYKRDGTPFRNAVMIAPFFEKGELIFFLGSQMEIETGGVSGLGEIAKAKVARLSPRQLQVLHYMSRGLRHAQIASELGVSEKTVKMHRAGLVAKLGCTTSAEAIRIAIEAGL